MSSLFNPPTKVPSLVVDDTLTVAGDAGHASTKKLYLDGVAMTGDTYLVESSANVLSLFSGGVEAKFTSGVLTVGGLGTHSFSASGNSPNALQIVNNTSGTAATCKILLATTTFDAGFIAFSAGFSTTAYNIASSAQFYSNGTAGMSVVTGDAAGTIKMYAGGTTLSGTWTGTALNVVGALSKGSGTFLIDHPLEAMARTHDLYHGFVEAPRYDLIYRGTATLKHGKASVDIDAASRMTAGTFAALTQNAMAMVQHEAGAAITKRIVTGGTLTIECDAAAGRVDWVVIAERADPFIHMIAGVDADGRMVPEQPKASVDPTYIDDDGLRHPDARDLVQARLGDAQAIEKLRTRDRGRETKRDELRRAMRELRAAQATQGEGSTS